MTRRPAALLAVLLAAASGCGKKGPPLPPLLDRPQPVSGMRLKQIGQHLVLSFAKPASRTSGSALSPEVSIEISLSPESYGGTPPNDETIWTIPSSDWATYERGSRLEVWLSVASVGEALREAPGGPPLSGRGLGFLARVVEPEGRSGEPALTSTVSFCAPPEPPSAGHPLVVEDGIHLSFDAGRAAIPGGRLNIYRAGFDETLPESPIVSLEVQNAGDISWRDGDAVFGTPYRYVARLEPSPGCESANSLEVAETRIDRFAPAPPGGLVAVAEEGAIRLFWRPGREPDLGGYRVWRTVRPDGEMVLITPESLPTASFTDATVLPGVVYFYTVTARDRSDPANESSRSESVSETAGVRP